MLVVTASMMLLLAVALGAIFLTTYYEQYKQVLGVEDAAAAVSDEAGASADSFDEAGAAADSFDEAGGRPDQGQEPPNGDIVPKDRGISAADLEIQRSFLRHFGLSTLKNTAYVALIFLVVLLVVSYWVAGLILKPLEQAYAKQKQFISDAGHELKTPIAAIDANVELLRRDIGENRWLESIRYESDRMNHLIRQLLDLARAEAKAASFENLEFDRVLMGGILPYEGVAFEHGYTLIDEIEPDLHVLGDQGQLEQVIAILMDNAISHAQGDGEITVRAWRARDQVYCAVSNPGEQMSDAQMQNLFERFYRTDEARTGDGHYGLGLSIAKAIVDAHKGLLSVESTPEETTFTVRLPAVKI